MDQYKKVVRVVLSSLFLFIASACVETRLHELPENALIIDVRSQTEYSMDALPCAKSLPWYKTSETQATKLLGEDKNRPIVLYCLSGHRSETAKKRLEAQGYTKVYDGGSVASMERLVGRTKGGFPCKSEKATRR